MNQSQTPPTSDHDTASNSATDWERQCEEDQKRMFIEAFNRALEPLAKKIVEKVEEDIPTIGRRLLGASKGNKDNAPGQESDVKSWRARRSYTCQSVSRTLAAVIDVLKYEKVLDREARIEAEFDANAAPAQYTSYHEWSHAGVIGLMACVPDKSGAILPGTINQKKMVGAQKSIALFPVKIRMDSSEDDYELTPIFTPTSLFAHLVARCATKIHSATWVKRNIHEMSKELIEVIWAGHLVSKDKGMVGVFDPLFEGKSLAASEQRLLESAIRGSVAGTQGATIPNTPSTSEQPKGAALTTSASNSNDSAQLADASLGGLPSATPSPIKQKARRL